MTEHDPVDSPSHYTSGGIECIDAIEAALTPEEASGFRKGNAMKYLWRAGKKGDVVEDLRKAQWYLDREVFELTYDPDESEPETGVDSAALMQEIQQRAYAEFLAGQKRAGFLVDLDPADAAPVASRHEAPTERPHPDPDHPRGSVLARAVDAISTRRADARS